MTDDLLVRAQLQAERSAPPVRAAARMRIARVQSATDPGQARVIFEMALDEIRSLPSRESQVLFEQAQQIAAAFAPDLLHEIPAVRRFPSDSHSETLLSIMLAHGHIDAAFDYVVHCDVPFGFPFGYAANLMQKLDDDRRLIVLRRAMDAWRAPQDSELMRKHGIPHEGDQGKLINNHLQSHFIRLQGNFIRLFQYRWTMLPREEALALVREIVNIALDRPDLGTSARYPDVHITSSREHVLFEVLHILRHLDPPLAESLIASHSQLAAAAQRYPNGTETMHQELELRADERRKEMAASGENSGEAFIMVGAGDPRNFDRLKALHRSSQQGDFGPSIDHALELYREDTDPNSPNQALKAFWPSARSFRATLYAAGKRLGPNAATLLDDISDDDLRLFAQIEFAAALAGLPASHETSMKRRPPPMQSDGEDEATVMSPKPVPPKSGSGSAAAVPDLIDE